MSPTRLASIYNPENQSREDLINSFVIRIKEFKKIMRRISDSGLDDTPQHFLIEGQRGTGKTSLLLRLQYAIEAHSSTSHLLPVRLREEQYNVFDLCRLWENVADFLDEVPGFETASEQMHQRSNDSDYDIICFDILDQLLADNKKRLILLLDNFGDMLIRLSKTEDQRLRDILHRSKNLQLIAASAYTLETTYRYDQVFFEFFNTIRLEGLQQPEAHRLLTMLGQQNEDQTLINNILRQQPERIETIRRITDGIPRTLILLYEIFVDESASVFQDLESILDKVTPLYKHRMDDLSTQQQAIVDVVALNWDGLSVKEIEKKLNSKKFTSKSISSQLSLLDRNNIICSKFINKKDKIYLIQERFFNIWYLMRCGRKRDQSRVTWLIRFLEAWCSPEELEQRARRHIDLSGQNKVHQYGGALVSEAMAALIKDPKIKDELRFISKKYQKGGKDAQRTSANKEENHHIAEAIQLLQDNESEKARRVLRNSGLSKEVPVVQFLMALSYHQERCFSKAIEFYRQAIEQGRTNAMNNLALLYETEFKDYDQAVDFYRQAIEQGHTDAMFNLALLYQTEFKDYDQAVDLYRQAIEQGGHPDTMNNLALLYYQQGIQKDQALHLIDSLQNEPLEGNDFHTVATVLLWDNQIELSQHYFRKWLALNLFEQYFSDAVNYFLLLLAKNQYHMALDYFEQVEGMKEKLKPLYFALMTLMKHQFPKEHFKAGSELEETIDEILQTVEKMRDKYA